MMLPTAFVQPSLKTILVPTWRNSGPLMKQNRHEALSPVLQFSVHSEDGGCMFDAYHSELDYRETAVN